MPDSVITWASLAAALSFQVVIIGAVIRISNSVRNGMESQRRTQDKNLKEEADKLHERVSRLQSEFHLYRAEVAKSYVHNQHLSDVETRLTKSLDGLAEEVRNLMKILIKREG